MYTAETEHEYKQYATVLDNDFRLMETATQGIPAAMFRKVANFPSLNSEHLAAFLGVSVKTMQRHDKDGRRLSPTHSEHLLKIIHLFNLGGEVFGNTDEFSKWLHEPAYGLGRKTPIELLYTIVGIGLVEGELTRIAYGDLA